MLNTSFTSETLEPNVYTLIYSLCIKMIGEIQKAKINHFGADF